MSAAETTASSKTLWRSTETRATSQRLKLPRTSCCTDALSASCQDRSANLALSPSRRAAAARSLASSLAAVASATRLRSRSTACCSSPCSLRSAASLSRRRRVSSCVKCAACATAASSAAVNVVSRLSSMAMSCTHNLHFGARPWLHNCDCGMRHRTRQPRTRNPSRVHITKIIRSLRRQGLCTARPSRLRQPRLTTADSPVTINCTAQAQIGRETPCPNRWSPACAAPWTVCSQCPAAPQARGGARARAARCGCSTLWR